MNQSPLKITYIIKIALEWAMLSSLIVLKFISTHELVCYENQIVIIPGVFNLEFHRWNSVSPWNWMGVKYF